MANRTSEVQSSAPSLEHVPPHSVEAEMSVLGSMMLDRHAVGEALQVVKAEDFYVPSHQVIARVLIDLYDKNVPIDFVTMLDALKARGGAEEVGGGEYLAQLAESVPSAANAEHYAKIVRNKALLRNFISTTGQLISEAFAEQRTTEEFLDHAEQMIFDVTERKETGKAEGLKDILQVAFEEIEQAAADGQTGLKTDFYKLDELLGGFQKGEMVVMAARPSVGKTSLAMNIVENAAVLEGAPLAVFSLEMRRTEIAKRLLASRSGINSAKLKGHLSDGEYGQLMKTAGELAEAKIFIDDTPGQTMLDIRAKSRRLKAQHDIRLVVIDYLQLVHPPRGENRQVQVAEMSRGVKSLARELNIPVLCLCQLNREIEHSERLPRLADIRESGAIEQDADVVLLLHRPQEKYTSSETGLTTDACIVIAKNRNGPTGIVPLNFHPEYVRFVNPTMEHSPV